MAKKKVDKIKYENKEFIPSEYQVKIFDNIVHGSTNMIINAVAGSGKSTTIVNALQLIPDDMRVLYIAFNKDIVNALKEKTGHIHNVNIMTYHSLGYAIVTENLKYRPELDEFKYTHFIRTNVKELTDDFPKDLNQVGFYSYVNNIIKLTDYARFNLCQSEHEINDVAKKYNIDLIHNECKAVEKVLEWGSTNLKSVDYTDMVWLPYELDYKTKKFRYNWIFVDEAQDSSPVQQKLFAKCLKRGARFCAVGDSSQCINAFAGADIHAFSNFANMSNTEEFNLPISYRCPKAIVEKAKKFVPIIEARENAEDGEINYNVDPKSPVSGDMVLCRNTYPLVKLYIDYLRINKKSFIRGKDIGNNLIELIKSTKEDKLNRSLTSDGVFVRLYRRMFDLRNQMMSLYGIDKNDALFSSKVMELYDSIMALEILSEGLTESKQLVEKISAIFLDSDGDGVCLSTVHKSKGLEADNVFILCPSLMPSVYAKQEWEITSERNLEYVAITRAKKTLNFIDEDKFKVERGRDFNEELLEKLNYTEKMVDLIIKPKKINGKKSEKCDLTSIINIKKERVKEEKKSKIGANKFSRFLKK